MRLSRARRKSSGLRRVVVSVSVVGVEGKGGGRVVMVEVV